jgi:hypothetical protein
MHADRVQHRSEIAHGDRLGVFMVSESKQSFLALTLALSRDGRGELRGTTVNGST